MNEENETGKKIRVRLASPEDFLTVDELDTYHAKKKIKEYEKEKTLAELIGIREAMEADLVIFSARKTEMDLKDEDTNQLSNEIKDLTFFMNELEDVIERKKQEEPSIEYHVVTARILVPAKWWDPDGIKSRMNSHLIHTSHCFEATVEKTVLISPDEFESLGKWNDEHTRKVLDREPVKD